MTTTPRGLKAGGRRLWAVASRFDLDQSSSAVLAEACHTVDLLADLRAEVTETQALIDSPQGVRIHPLYVEIRQQRLTLARLIAAVGLPRDLPDDDDEDETDAR